MDDVRPLLDVVKQTWIEQKRALQIDISILQMVEDLELRVVGADLQLKVRLLCLIKGKKAEKTY